MSILEHLSMLTGVYALLLAMTALFGIIDRNSGVVHGCENNMMRIEYAMPGFRVGCWLGERIEGGEG